MVQDLQGLLQAFRGKEEVARAEVEAFMNIMQRGGRPKRTLTSSSDVDSCVRDSPEQGNAV